jgi:aerobic carbon-monoxide dehydrogenase medium subunit
MLLNPITFHLPTTTVEAAKLYATLSEAKLLAGGTFLLNSLKSLKHKGLKTPKHVISLKKINELKGIEANKERLLIRSMTTITDLFNFPDLDDNFSVLKTVCRNISTNPIRNMATVGGNLTCRYTWTELGAVIITLEADMHFIGSDGNDEVISAENFFNSGAKTNKIFSHLTIKRDKTASVGYQRIKKSSDVDIPMLAVCAKTNFVKNRFSQTRVTVNSWTTFAKRDAILENFLNQSSADQDVAHKALNHLDTTIYDTRSDDYKKAMFRVSIKNVITKLVNHNGGKV